MLNTGGINSKTYYSVKEASMFIGIKPNTIRLWISQKKIKNIKMIGARRLYVLGQDILDIVEDR